MTQSGPITQAHIRDLARRALAAWKVDDALFVTPDEYVFLRNAETETWNMALVAECAELGMTTPHLESVRVIVIKTGARSRVSEIVHK
jgi:hypothetical protein